MLLALRPGVGLGPFALGQALPEVLAYLHQHKADFRCVEIKYSEKATLAHDIQLSFPEHGFQLLFEPAGQRLRLVEVFDASRLRMVYGRSAVFGGASNAPTFGRVYEAFGPTYPGEPEGEGRGYYPLQYPGILLLFPLPPGPHFQHQQQQQRQQPAAASAGAGGYGMAEAGAGGARAAPCFPVPLAAVAERIFIHAGTRGPLPAVLASPPPPPEPGSAPELLEAVPCHGLYLGPGCTGAVRLGDSPQDVLSLLGQPARVVHKCGGVLAGAAPAANGAAAAAVPDYFYCYPGRGLDLLFCGTTHRLRKAVLHTNLPGHPDFNAYCKARFRVHPCGWRPPQVLRSAEPGGFQGSGSEEEREGPAAVEQPAVEQGQGALPARPLLAAAAPVSKHDAGVGPDRASAGSCGLQQQQQHLREGERLSAKQEARQEGQAAALPGQQGEDGERPAGGLAAAYHMLVGLIDDVMTLDPQTIAPDEAGSRGGADGNSVAGPSHTAVAAAVRDDPAPGPEGTSKAAEAGAAAAAASAAGAGKPPKPPAPPAAAAPPPAPASAKGGKKGKKSKKKRAAAAAAAAAASGAGQAEEEGEADSLADASASDSGFDSSSLASSPGLASHFVGPSRRRLGGLAGGYLSSDWGSGADLAAREGSVGCGSVLDGWSDADDLFPMVASAPQSDAEGGGPRSVAGSSPPASAAAAAAAAGPGGGAPESGQAGALGFEGGVASLAAWALPEGCGGGGGSPAASALTAALAQRGSGAGKGSTGVQTVDTAVGPDGSEGGGVFAGTGAMPLADLEGGWAEEDSGEGSPQRGYVLPGRPSLFDEGAAAAEYERVPQQRDCGTQTPSHLFASPAARQRAAGGAAGGAGAAGRGGSGSWAGAGAPQGPAGAAAVTADSSLEEVQALFGHAGGPALHNRLAGSHPFGPSFLYAYRGVVFEVLQNGLIATVTIFKP